MKTKDLLLLIGGIVVGALIGAFAIIGTRPDQSAEITSLQSQISELQNQVAAAPTPVFRTVNEAAATSDFYLVGFEETVKWIEETLELELTDEQKEALESITSEIMDEATLSEQFADQESDLFVTLQFIYDQLLEKRGENDSPVSVCFALENDFYTGTLQYLYLQVPSESEKAMGFDTVAEDVWKRLDSPLPNTQTWFSECVEPDTALTPDSAGTSGS